MELQPRFERFMAIDLHNQYLLVGGLNAQHQVVLPLRRISLPDGLPWAQQQVRPTDAVVLEATTTAWTIDDQVQPLVGRVVVAHPANIPGTTGQRVKTDKRDVLRFARLLIANLIPAVWVPPPYVRDRRSLLADRRRLVKLQTMSRNRLQRVLHSANVQPPTGDPFAAKNRMWWQTLAVSPTEQLRMQQDLATLDYVTPQIMALDAALRRLRTSGPWKELPPYLIHLPGFGLITTMTLVAAIGDITRFPRAKQLVSYAGLGVSVHASGETYRTGRITKEGRREVRWILVEAAHTAVRAHPHWRQLYDRLERRVGERKAIVAIARKLLVVVWHVVTEQTADRHADPEQVAFKLMTWAWKLTDAQRGNVRSRQFIRYHLLRLGLGHQLTHITRGGTKRPLAAVAEVLTLRPELRGPPTSDYGLGQRRQSRARFRLVPDTLPVKAATRERALGQRKAALRASLECGPRTALTRRAAEGVPEPGEQHGQENGGIASALYADQCIGGQVALPQLKNEWRYTLPKIAA